ncbi:MAG: histidine kinase [Halomonas sp. 54_146]|nr:MULTISPECIES: response regulator [unclassified Halomonas]KUJ86852.1 MAG: histidine kinase [Halomonas sp. 54_146]HAA44188.1 response regulator [Halomonas sp.]
MQRNQSEHFWNAIVWPVLWPLLLMQAALIVLCLIVGAMVWWVSPSYISWSTTLWLMLALLVGSSLNVSAFLMLIKTRARHENERFIQELTELERHSQALCATAVPSQPVLPGGRALSAADQSYLPLQRLVSVNEALGSLQRAIHYSQDGRAAFDNAPHEHAQTLLDELQHQQHQLKHLMAERERTREESRLKSGYLTLLQRETDNLFEYLDALAEKDTTEECQQHIRDGRERLVDIRALLANVVQHGSESNAERSAEQSAESHSESRSENSLDQGSARQVQKSASSQRHLRVLVVDDGPVNLMLARQMLETQGLQVQGASSGEQALERQQSATFDLVFMDIFMPILDGLETSRQWREYERTQGDHRSVLVALTANADDARREACLAAGMNDLLAKPYQPETLLNMIAYWFPATVKIASPAQ